MFGTTVSVSDVPFVKRLFPGYRKRKVVVKNGSAVTLSNLNWDGGSRSEYFLVDLVRNTVIPIGNNTAAPWNNPDEGRSVTVEPGTAVVKTGTFCGKPSTMVITFNPADKAGL